MSAAAGPARVGQSTRRGPRCPLAVPVDVTALRSGVPDNIPGRSLDIGEGGVAVALAGELHPGDSVGVVFRLPEVGMPLHAKAIVRHQAHLRCGLEFLGLSPEQEAMIRYWVGRAREKQPETQASVVGYSWAEKPEPEPPALDTPSKWRTANLQALCLALALFVLVGALGWWQWYRAWDELESRIPVTDAATRPGMADEVPAKVPAEIMEKLVTHKVEPVYPDTARHAKVQGVVLLRATIGQDGDVIDVRPLSGPRELAPAAVEAVKWWRFEPYRVNGKTVKVDTTVTVEFQAAP